MPLPMTSDVRNALKARNIANVWIMEMFTDEATLRGCSVGKSLSFESNTFEPLGDDFKISGQIKTGVDLVSEPLVIELNAAGILDDTTFVGRLVDNQWYQRRIRVRQLLFTPGEHFNNLIGSCFEWFGYMDMFEEGAAEDESATLILTCESGIFRARGRNMHTYTDKDQRLYDAADASFVNTATKPFQSIPFGESWSTVPGYRGGGSTGASGPRLFESQLTT
jgi:hypothetical protein